MSRILKCQAKNPSLCTDPQCPEMRSYSHQLGRAQNFDQYSAVAQQRHAAQQRRGVAQMSQQMQKNGYRPTRPVKKETTYDGDPVVKFHRDLGFPPGFTPPSGSRKVAYSQHATDEAQKDRYGAIPQLSSVNLDQMELVELKVNARTKQVYRFLYRAELDDENDICLVLQPEGNGRMRVITNWINRRDDVHRSLREEEYVRPRAVPA